MFSVLRRVLLCGLILLCAQGCDSEAPIASVCIPGTAQACPCEGFFQECKQDGSGYTACECPGLGSLNSEGGEESSEQGGEASAEEGGEASGEEGGEAPAEEGGEAPAEEGGEASAEEGGEEPTEEGGEEPTEEGGEESTEEGGEEPGGDPCETLTNEGCVFFAVDLDNIDGDESTPGASNAQFAIVVLNVSDTDATITVRSTDEGEATAGATVSPGASEIFTLDPYNGDGTMKMLRSWKVESDTAIVAFQFNPLENEAVFSNDASSLIPSNTWGNEYYVMSRDQLDDYGRSYFTVVAGENTADVTITVSASTNGGVGVAAMEAGETKSFTLEPYEILNIESASAGGDLTGSRIVSSAPVGVFGGHECAVTSDQCCCDHLEHMLTPVSTWGTTHIASRGFARGVEPEYWRILASEDGTVVTTTPSVDTIPTLNAGDYFEIQSTDSFEINSTKPVMVGRYFASSYEINGSCAAGCQNGTSCDTISQVCVPSVSSCSTNSDCPGGHTCVEYDDGLFGAQISCEPIGDPAFILAVPVEQFRSFYDVFVPDQFLQNYVTITAPVGTGLTLNDNQSLFVEPLSDECTDIGCWGAITLEIGQGNHGVESIDGTPFGLSVYGFDDDVSYGYAGGMSLKTL